MNRQDVAPIAGSEEATIPFFSPDGQWVGFFAGGKLKKIPLAGGPGVTLCEARWGGASWGPDDTIIFTPEYNQGLSRVSAVGGTPQVLTTPDRSAGEFAHWWPEILPDGKAVLFTVWTTARFEETRIAVLSLETGKKRVLIEGGTHPRYVQSGHLLYAKGDTLMAVPFDASRLEVTGTPMPVVEGVMIDTFGGFAHYSTARDGTVVYIPSSAEARRLVWVDRRGKEVLLSEEQRRFETPRLSPDGKRVAVAIHEPNPDVWVLDLTRTTLTRLTFDPASEFVPVWTPDGRRLAFIHDTPPFDLFWKAADGSGSEEPLFKSEHDKYPNSWSPDGRVLAFTEQHPVTGPDIWLLPLHGERKPQPFLRTRFEEGAAAFSPDGRWLAYTSNETGRFEIYVQPYPGPGPKSQISTEGGTEPAWSRNGRELFYRNGQKMMAVSVTTQPTFRAGKPSLLFQGPLSAGRPNRLVNYDVSPDGQRLLMILHSQEEAAPTQLNVVLNWFEELKRRVPSGKK